MKNSDFIDEVARRTGLSKGEVSKVLKAAGLVLGEVSVRGKPLLKPGDVWTLKVKPGKHVTGKAAIFRPFMRTSHGKIAAKKSAPYHLKLKPKKRPGTNDPGPSVTKKT